MHSKDGVHIVFNYDGAVSFQTQNGGCAITINYDRFVHFVFPIQAT